MIPTYNPRANAMDGWRDRDFWLQAPFMSEEFRHLDEIAFDYRGA
jgi:hypothetical protein